MSAQELPETSIAATAIALSLSFTCFLLFAASLNKLPTPVGSDPGSG
jgi:hypothetical protein